MTTYEKLTELLSSCGAEFSIIEHQQEGRSEEIAKIRGNSIQQSAKAMVLVAKTESGERNYFLVVLPGHRRVSFSKIKNYGNATSVKLASPQEVLDLTNCVLGAVPPISFDERLKLMVDPELIELNERIVFNAGRLDRSIFLNVRDYTFLLNKHHAVIQTVSEPPSG